MTNGAQNAWSVRAARSADFGHWRELYQGYADFYRTPQADAAAELVWGWIHEPTHEVGCLLATGPDGSIAGFAHYRPFARPLAAATGCFLDDLYVDPAHRGTGAVDALLGELRRLAAARGWSVIRWITAADNERARAAYDRQATRTEWVTYDMAPD